MKGSSERTEVESLKRQLREHEARIGRLEQVKRMPARKRNAAGNIIV
jgi:hypothetical protein